MNIHVFYIIFIKNIFKYFQFFFNCFFLKNFSSFLVLKRYIFFDATKVRKMTNAICIVANQNMQ